MEKNGHERREVTEKKILLPVAGPRQIEKHCAHFERKYDQQCAIKPAHGSVKFRPAGNGSGSTDGLLKGGDAFGHVTIVDVHRIDLGETLQRRFRLARRLLSYAQIIPQGERAFRIIAGSLQSALVPDRGNGWLALLHEGQTEKCAALHGVAEGAPAIGGFGNFLELAGGLFEKPHFPKRDSQVVMRFKIFVLRAHLTKFGAELVEHFLERAR